MSDHYVNPELGTHAKPFGKNRGGRKMVDLEDFDELHALACRLASSPKSQMLSASLDELHALAKFAADCGEVAALAIDVFAASDEGADKPQITAAMSLLAHSTRSLIRSPS